VIYPHAGCFFSVPLQRGGVRHFAAEFVTKAGGIVGIDLGIVAATGDGDICESRIDEPLVGVLRVHMNQDAVGGGALTTVASDRVAVIEMGKLLELQIDRAPGVQANL
jgi:hypothetical protein